MLVLGRGRHASGCSSWMRILPELHLLLEHVDDDHRIAGRADGRRGRSRTASSGVEHESFHRHVGVVCVI